MTIRGMRQRTGRRRVRPTGDEGVTLVEVVISISLMGLVVVPLLLAVSASIKSSSVSRSAAQVETLLVNAVDRVNRSDRGSFACDVSGPVVAAVETVGWSTSSVTVVQEYLNETSGIWVPGDSGTLCPAGGFYAGIVQRVTITITSPDERVSRTLQVVRGDI